MLPQDDVQSVLVSDSEAACVQRFRIKTCTLKGRLSLCADAMNLFKYKNSRNIFFSVYVQVRRYLNTAHILLTF